jgi:hypothetical protein
MECNPKSPNSKHSCFMFLQVLSYAHISFLLCKVSMFLVFGFMFWAWILVCVYK